MSGVGGFLWGGVGGDAAEYSSRIVGCLCCLFFSGPVLVIISIVMFFGSFQDHRLSHINQYNTYVQDWNTGLGVSRAFENLNFTASVISGAGQQTTILGGIAPEDVRDKSLRGEEVFKTVNNPWYYTTNPNGRGSQLVGMPSSWSAATTEVLTLRIQQPSSQGPSSVLPDLTFKRVIAVDTQYRWYVSRSSSASSSSITCRNPSYDYPGTRFSGKITCEDWCQQNGGQWGGGSDCFASRTTSEARGCCTVYWVATEACFRVSTGGTGAGRRVVATKQAGSNANSRSGYGCWASHMPSSKHVELDYDENSFSDVASDVGQLSGSVSRVGLLYKRFTRASLRNYSPERFAVSLRHEDDPWSGASDITDGCSSCTGERMPNYGDTCRLTDDNKQCFGLTPGQIRAAATGFLVVGLLLSTFPAFVIYKACSRKKRSNQQQVPQQRYVTHVVTQQTMASQPGMAQPVMAQPVMAQPVMAQPVMAQPAFAQPVVMQPTITQYPGQPQPVYMK